jgi:hypothetical protein
MRKLLLFAVLAALTFNLPVWAESPKPLKPPTQTQSAKTTKSETLPTPLPAEMFQGRVQEAYKAAAEIPDVLAHVSCYCGCSKSHGHRNLLDCFVDDHGAG